MSLTVWLFQINEYNQQFWKLFWDINSLQLQYFELLDFPVNTLTRRCIIMLIQNGSEASVITPLFLALPTITQCFVFFFFPVNTTGFPLGLQSKSFFSPSALCPTSLCSIQHPPAYKWNVIITSFSQLYLSAVFSTVAFYWPSAVSLFLLTAWHFLSYGFTQHEVQHGHREMCNASESHTDHFTEETVDPDSTVHHQH